MMGAVCCRSERVMYEKADAGETGEPEDRALQLDFAVW